MAARLKKGDQVIVIAGKDKGKRGEVLRVINAVGRVVVSNVNVVTKHAKPSKKVPQGGILKFEAPIDASNLAHIDPKLDSATKIGYKFLADGKKVRYAKKSGEVIDN